MLQGYRTYIIAVLIGCVAAAHYLGLIDASVSSLLFGLLGGGGLATTRKAIEDNS